MSAFIVVFASTASASDVRVSVTEVSDQRTTGEFFKKLEIKLRLTGDDAVDIKGIKKVIKKAVDDTGRNLIAEDEHSTGFDSVSDSGSGPELSITLKNPARKASVVKELSGEVQLFAPDKDPKSVVLVKKFTKTGGKPVDNPAFKKAKLKLTVMTKEEYDAFKDRKQKESEEEAKQKGLEDAMVEAMSSMFSSFFSVGENDLIFKVEDPEGSLIDMDVLNSKGEHIESNGITTADDVRVIGYTDPLPKGAQLRVYLKTSKSVITVPFTIADIALP